MGPFKCPECGIWWAGIEHRCTPAAFSDTTNAYLFGHCHGCSTALCRANDHQPCMQHQNGWSTITSGLVTSTTGA